MDGLREERRERLRAARLQLLFTPALCPGDPLEVLQAVLPWIGAIQVRVPHPEGASRATPARELFDWTERVLELLRARPDPPLVLVNDRVDVAACLEAQGVAGVHLGEDDTPPEVARRSLSASAVVGVSTHSPAAVARRSVEPAVDYLGFGPIHPTSTKGYARGLGSAAAWMAQAATSLPVFPIGGIDLTNAGDLSQVGRAAVCSAILRADDPAGVARSLYDLLAPDERP